MSAIDPNIWDNFEWEPLNPPPKLESFVDQYLGKPFTGTCTSSSGEASFYKKLTSDVVKDLLEIKKDMDDDMKMRGTIGPDKPKEEEPPEPEPELFFDPKDLDL